MQNARRGKLEAQSRWAQIESLCGFTINSQAPSANGIARYQVSAFAAQACLPLSLNRKN